MLFNGVMGDAKGSGKCYDQLSLILIRHTRIAGMDSWDGLGPGPGNVLFIGGMSSLLVACPQPRFRNVWPDFPWDICFRMFL